MRHLALGHLPSLTWPWHRHVSTGSVTLSLLYPVHHGVRCVPSVSSAASHKPQYKPTPLDDLFLMLFRQKMAQEVGWDSEKPGYDGLIEVATRLMSSGKRNTDTKDAAVHQLLSRSLPEASNITFFSNHSLRCFQVRILKSLFPPLLLGLYKKLITPLSNGKVAATMVARVTAITCQWLMGICKVNSIELPDGTEIQSGVFVERCKYLEESKCVGICVNTCKLPTQVQWRGYGYEKCVFPV